MSFHSRKSNWGATIRLLGGGGVLQFLNWTIFYFKICNFYSFQTLSQAKYLFHFNFKNLSSAGLEVSLDL